MKMESTRRRLLEKKKTINQSSSWPLSEVIANGCFVEALALVEELSNVVAGIFQQVILNQELDPLEKRQGPGLHPAYENMWDKAHFWGITTVTSTYLFGVHVEFLSAHGHLFIPLHIFPETQTHDKIKHWHNVRWQITQNGISQLSIYSNKNNFV